MSIDRTSISSQFTALEDEELDVPSTEVAPKAKHAVRIEFRKFFVNQWFAPFISLCRNVKIVRLVEQTRAPVPQYAENPKLMNGMVYRSSKAFFRVILPEGIGLSGLFLASSSGALPSKREVIVSANTYHTL